jgi:hypothetical protein
MSREAEKTEKKAERIKKIQAKPRISNSLIGAAGVHFVVSELSLKGLIALPTVRNTAGIDVVVVSEDGTWHANLQVKTSQKKISFWPVNKHFSEWLGKKNFYVFIRYVAKESRFEAFLESAKLVAKEVAESGKKMKEKGNVEWAPCWYLPKDDKAFSIMRKKWQEFGPRVEITQP